MRKPALVRAIYAELRFIAGPEVAAADLLKIAHHFLRAYTDPPDELKEFGVATEGRPFSSLPVDEAMSDGGWRILMSERRTTSWTDRRDPLEMSRLVPILNYYLGPEWQQFNWDGHALIESE